eukprot:6884164-Pyramimonas_sp.AAC.1
MLFRIRAEAADIGYDSMCVYKVRAHLTVSSPAEASWSTMGRHRVERLDEPGAPCHRVDGAAVERLRRSNIFIECVGNCT